jgi:hypothetical protein
MKWLFLTVCSICKITFGSHAQSDTAKTYFESGLNIHAGKLVKIHGEYPATSIASVHELSLLWKCKGNKPWHGAHAFPSAGLSFIHTQFGNKDILGQAIGLVPQMRFEKRFSESFVSIRAGLGIAWFNKPYDARTNPENLVIGSRLANLTQVAVEWNRYISQHIIIRFGGSFTHCSGAHVAVPNIGANLPAFTIGVGYQPRHFSNDLFRKKIKTSFRQTTFGAQLINGLHEFPGTIRPADGPRYIVYGLGLHASRSWRIRGKASAGLNLHYYTAYADYIRSQELIESKTFNRLDPMNLVLFVGYEWNFGRVSFFIQGGVNLYDPVLRALNQVWDLPKHGWLHQFTANKIGYRVYLHKQQEPSDKRINPFVHIAVKSNGGTADFLEFAIGIDLKGTSKNPEYDSTNSSFTH